MNPGEGSETTKSSPSTTTERTTTMDHAGELCAALPVTALHVSVWGCHAHQALTLTASGTSQVDQDLTVWWRPAPVDLGPFDGIKELADAYEAITGRGGAHLPDLLRRVRS